MEFWTRLSLCQFKFNCGSYQRRSKNLRSNKVDNTHVWLEQDRYWVSVAPEALQMPQAIAWLLPRWLEDYFGRIMLPIFSLLHDDEANIEEHWWRVIEFLEVAGNGSVVLNADRFQVFLKKLSNSLSSASQRTLSNHFPNNSMLFVSTLFPKL